MQEYLLTRNIYRALLVSVFVVAIILRLLLCWLNPPDNTFDNHYEPIAYIVNTGKIPAKDACFQCYQPPVFYFSSAVVAQTLEKLGMTATAIVKSLQFLNCFYGILTLLVIYLILKRLHFSEMSRLIAFGIICFLPRHIFMSAIHSNDGLTYLAISFCTYLLLITIDRELSLPCAGLLGITLAVTIFVKYTAFLVLPMVAVPLLSLVFLKSSIPRTRSVTVLLMVLLPALISLGIYMTDNFKEYGHVLPWNDTMFNTGVVHPRDPEVVSFTTFTPWQYIEEPIIIPGQMHSFWTLVYSGMWIDNEPKFTDYTDSDKDWWKQYFSWLRGEQKFFPSSPIPISNSTRIFTVGLLVCGLVPLGLIIIGLIRCLFTSIPHKASNNIFEAVKLQAFPVMLFFNAVGVFLLVLKAPVYSSMKAAYFLNSMPSLCVCIAFGIQYLEKSKWTKILVCVICCASLLLALLYLLWILIALEKHIF